MRNFQAEVERFLSDHEMSPSTLGFEALGDYCFVRDLRAGRSPRLVTVEKVTAWMEAYDAEHPNKKRREWLRLRRAEAAGARRALAAERAKAKNKQKAAQAKRVARQREARAST